MLLTVTDIHVTSNVRLDDPDTAGLITSMKAVGQITPITVRETEGGYVVVAGHRRLAAAAALEWERIEAYVVDGTAAPLALQIAENVSRQDLQPYELAQGVLALREETGMTQDQIAEALGFEKKYVSELQKIGKGTQGLDPTTMNQLGFAELEPYSHIHDMPDEMRAQLAESIENRGHDFWTVNEYVEEVEKYRWSRKKENKAFLQVMEDIGAVPMTKEETYQGKRLHGQEIEVHRGQPCHGYRVRSDWGYGNDTKQFAIDEYCLDPNSHKDAPERVLKAMAKTAKSHDTAGTVAQRAHDKARRETKTKRKDAVYAFAQKPRMRALTEIMVAAVMNIQQRYRWQELGKTFGMAKSDDGYHFEWDVYLDRFNAKDRATQELILALGSWYLTLDGTYSSRHDDLIAKMDELFGADIEHGVVDGGEEE